MSDGGGDSKNELRRLRSIKRAMEMLIRHSKDDHYTKLLFNTDKRIKEIDGDAEENQ